MSSPPHKDPNAPLDAAPSRGYLVSSFSLNMLAPSLLDDGVSMHVSSLSLEQARVIAKELPSMVGHRDTAGLFANLLQRPVEHHRGSLVVQRGDWLLVGQYTGPRLPEGTTELPRDATIRWLRVTVR